jgi:hypothetical protein
MRVRLLLAVTPLLAAPAVEAATRRVPSDYPKIQEAMDASAVGDTVLVAPGTYSDHEAGAGGTQICVSLRDGVTLRSEAGAAVTTISMLDVVNGSLFWGNNLTSGTTIEGFTFTSAPDAAGAGRFSSCGQATIRDCVFRDLSIFSDAGVGCYDGDLDVINCRFVNIEQPGGLGALNLKRAHFRVINTSFVNCHQRAIYMSSDGLNTETLLIENCQFVNCSGSNGGAVLTGLCIGGITIRGCLFQGNVDHSTGGGALALTNFGTKLVENCVFLFNETVGANGRGGAINFITFSECTVRGSTFFGNHQAVSGGGGAAVALSSGSSGILENNIVAGCTGSAAIYKGGTNTVTTGCNVFWQNDHGNTGGSYVLGPTDRDVNPIFCGPADENFTLGEASPCLPQDSLGCGLIGAFDQGCGVVSVDSQSWSEIKGAYRGPSRP